MPEFGHASLLLSGRRTAAWTRVVGDVVDLAALGHARRSPSGERLGRLDAAGSFVLGMAVTDTYAAMRSSRSLHRSRTWLALPQGC